MLPTEQWLTMAIAAAGLPDGNTCRSPMAQALGRRIFGDMVGIESAGVSAHTGAPAAAHAVAVTAEKGLDLRGHTARCVADLDLSHFDLIVAMDGSVAQRSASEGRRPSEWSHSTSRTQSVGTSTVTAPPLA
jgi:protein-tyrosine-phosphatase